MDNTIYIYGHRCNHNLIKPKQDYDYDWIRNDAVRSVQAKWAITPFNNNDVLEYHTVCREFGRPLEMVHHHWNAIMDVHRLWYIVEHMDWSQITPEERANTSYKYHNWYQQYFKDIYSVEDWNRVLGL